MSTLTIVRSVPALMGTDPDQHPVVWLDPEDPDRPRGYILLDKDSNVVGTTGDD